MEITGHTVEVLEDPFGLLDGERFEFFLNFVEQSTEKILDFALEDDEENLVKSYCKDNSPLDDAEQKPSEKEQDKLPALFLRLFSHPCCFGSLNGTLGLCFH